MQPLHQYAVTVDVEDVPPDTVRHLLCLQAHPLRAVRVAEVRLESEELQAVGDDLRIQFLTEQLHLRGYQIPSLEVIGTGDAKPFTIAYCLQSGVPGNESFPGTDVTPSSKSARFRFRFDDASAPWVPRGKRLDVVLAAGTRPIGKLKVTVVFDE